MRDEETERERKAHTRSIPSIISSRIANIDDRENDGYDVHGQHYGGGRITAA